MKISILDIDHNIDDFKNKKVRHIEPDFIHNG